MVLHSAKSSHWCFFVHSSRHIKFIPFSAVHCRVSSFESPSLFYISLHMFSASADMGKRNDESDPDPSPPVTGGDKLDSKSNLPGSQYHVFHIDVVPSNFLITPEVDQKIRDFIKHLNDILFRKAPGTPVTVTFLQGDHPHPRNDNVEFQRSVKPIWWKALCIGAEKEAKETSAFGCAWKSILDIKRAYECSKGCLADVSIISIGLCPAEQQNFGQHQSEGTTTCNFRLGGYTLKPGLEFFLATPPSLSWAFDVALEFQRIRAAETSSNNSDTNLTLETVGVLQNWTDFMLYGSIASEANVPPDELFREWVGKLDPRPEKRAVSWMTELTLVMDCGEAPKLANQGVLRVLSEAWNRVVTQALISGRGLEFRASEGLDDILAERIIKLCGLNKSPSKTEQEKSQVG